MKKIAAIHQPNFLPWLGYFFKIKQADVFILLDDVQYTKNSYINRNRIKTPAGVQWLTAPVLYKGFFGTPIREVRLHPDLKWKKKMLATLQGNYAQARFYSEYYPELSDLIENCGQSLYLLNLSLMKWVLKKMEIKTDIYFSSEMNIAEASTARLVALCKEVKASHYLCGAGARNYQEDALFEACGIQVMNSTFNHPEYPQLWGDFIPNLSILDALMNCGSQAALLLDSANVSSHCSKKDIPG